jgi:hypothetical protein
MSIEGKLTITRRRDSEDGDYMAIELRDYNAVITPVEIKISLHEFMMAISGMGYVPCTFEVSDLDKIGKVREQNRISFEIEKNDKKLAIQEAKKYTPAGWTAVEHYSSQDSINFMGNGKYVARTQILRWVDPAEPKVKKEFDNFKDNHHSAYEPTGDE